MRSSKILLLISAIVFSGDVGPLHKPEYIPIIAVLSTIMFAITTYVMFQNVASHRWMRVFAWFTALMLLAVGAITAVVVFTGNDKFYDVYSVILLLPVYLETILAFVLLRGKK